jgi:hypothetical protein
MQKFHGKIGFGEATESSPGVYVDSIVEHEYYGDVLNLSRSLRQGAVLNEDLLVGNLLSIMGSRYALENFLNIRYIEWSGELWTIENVILQYPRLILRLGEVYNGPTAATPNTP